MASRTNSGHGLNVPKWPQRESHPSSASDSDVTFTVDSSLPRESSTKTTTTTPARPHLQGRRTTPPNNHRPKGDVTFDNWNPMQEDYNDESFNTYNTGPAAGLSGTRSNRPGKKKDGKYTIFVGGLPAEMTEEGLSNLFSHVCNTLRVSVCPPKDEDRNTAFGFVDVPSVKDGEVAIRKLHGHWIRNRRLRVEFKKEKEQTDAPSSRRDSSDEWDPTPSGTSPANRVPSASRSRPSDSTLASSNSSESGESNSSSSNKNKKYAQPRKLADRYGNPTQPKSSGGDSKVTSPPSSAPAAPKECPVQAPESSVTGAGSKFESSHMAIMQKLRSAKRNTSKTAKEKTEVLCSPQKAEETARIPEGRAEVGGAAGGPLERKVDFSKAEEEASSGGSGKRESAEMPGRAGAAIPGEDRALGCSTSTADGAVGMTEAEEVGSSPGQPRARSLLSLSQRAGRKLTPDASARRDAEGKARAAKTTTPRREQGGILGPAPVPAQPGFPCYCPECTPREYLDADGLPSRPHPYQPHCPVHYHSPQPRNGPFNVLPHEGYPLDGDCHLCHHHTHSPSQKPLMPPPYSPGPHYGPPEPSYGQAFHQFGRGSPYPHSHPHRYPAPWREHPHGHYGSAMHQNSGYLNYRSKFPLGMRGKSDLPTNNSSKSATKTQKAPHPDEHPRPAGMRPSKGTVESADGPTGNGMAGVDKEPESTAMRQSPRASALPEPEGEPGARQEVNLAGKATAGGRGQGSSHKGASPAQQGSKATKPCLNCGKAGPLRCSQCKGSYCTQACQKDHWPMHRSQCRKATSQEGTQDGSKSSPAKPSLFTSPAKPTVVLHSGTPGQFMARNLPYETPDSQEMEVFVTEVESPGAFWVQLVQERNVKDFSKISESLSTAYLAPASEAELDYVPKVGGVCAAQYSEDGEWYRAELVCVDGDRHTVRLFDYGTVDVVSKSSLRKLQEEMLKVPKQALRCSLSGVKAPNDQWSKEATQMFQSLVNKDEGCTKAKFTGQGANGNTIDIYTAEDHSKTISSVLIVAGLAEATGSAARGQALIRPTDVSPAMSPLTSLGSVLDGLAVGARADICVSQVDSPGCFYANLAESAGDLLEMDRQMSERYAAMPPVKGFRPHLGELCAARFSQNDQWYRAVADESPSLAGDSTRLPVTFIDYGNAETVGIDECRPLEIGLAGLARLAVPCRLAGVGPKTPDTGWPEEMTEAFKNWLVDGQTSIVVKDKVGERVAVEIFSPQSKQPEVSFNTLLQQVGFECGETASRAPPSPGNAPSTNPASPATRGARPTTGRAPRGLPAAKHPLSEFQGLVTLVNNPSDFYLQVDSDENRQVLGVLEELNTRHADDEVQDLAAYRPRVREPCAALYTDKTWYRAVTLEHMAKESACKVLFVDFGNVEVLPVDQLRPLEERFYEMPIVALHCSLTCVMAPSGGNEMPWSEVATKRFTEKVLNECCRVHIVGSRGDLCDVELLYPGKGSSANELTSIKRELIKQGLAVAKDPCPSTPVPALAPVDRKTPTKAASPGPNQPGDAGCGMPRDAPASPARPALPAPKLPSDDFLGLVTAVGDRGVVYLQVFTEENAEKLQSLTEALNGCYLQAQPRPCRPHIGELCAIKYSVDNEWYRGRVVRESPATAAVDVLFVDFGNTERVPAADLHQLEEQFIRIPLLALSCRLTSVRMPSAADQARHGKTLEHLKSKILEKCCKVHIASRDMEMYEVEIEYSDDGDVWRSVNRELIDVGLAEPVSIQSPSPGPSGDRRSPGRKQSDSSSHRVMSPANGVRTTTPGPSGDAGTANQCSPLGRPEGGSVGEIPAAELPVTLPESDPLLAAFTGVLTAASHPCDFHLQVKNEEYIQLSQVLREELNRHYCRPDLAPYLPRVGELCAAMYSADREWYRAEVLERLATPDRRPASVRVRFVDYGNCEAVPAERIRALGGDFLEVPRLAHRCRLHGVTSPSGDGQGPWSAEAASFIFKELIERDKECQVTLVKQDGKVCVVELHYASQDGSRRCNLREELLKKDLARPSAPATASATAPATASATAPATAPATALATAPATASATTPPKGSRVSVSSMQKVSLPADSSIRVVVNEVVGPQEFYCQMAVEEEITKLQTLMNSMNSCVKTLTGSPAVGDLFLAKFTADEDWYRGEILKIKQSDKRALVHYVDFGNTEPLPWSRLADADAKFAELPMQAVRCGLSGVASSQPADAGTKAFLRDTLIKDPSQPKCFEATLCGVCEDGTSLVKLRDLADNDINKFVGMTLGSALSTLCQSPRDLCDTAQWRIFGGPGKIVRDYLSSKQPTTPAATSPGPSRTPGLTPTVSPAAAVVSPRGTATPDPAELEAMMQEIETKKRLLKAQIEAQQREIAEMEQLRVNLEQRL